MTFCSYFFNNLFFSISNKILNYLLFEEILYLLTFYRCFLEFFSIIDYLFYLEALLFFLFIFVMHYFCTHFFLASFSNFISFCFLYSYLKFSCIFIFSLKIFHFLYIYFIKWVRNFLNFFASFFVIDIFLGFSFLLLYLLHIYYSFCFSLNALCCIHFFSFLLCTTRTNDGRGKLYSLGCCYFKFSTNMKKNTTHLHTIATQQ